MVSRRRLLRERKSQFVDGPKMTALLARSYQTRDRALLGFRPRRFCALSRRSVETALDRACALTAAYAPPPSSVSSRSSSNGSLSCSGSLYGPPSQSGLGASRLGGLATSRSVGQPLANGAQDRALCAARVINASSNAVAVSEIKFGEVAVQMPLVTMLIDAGHAAL